MRHFKRIIWLILVLNIVLLAYVVIEFSVDDMTLSKGQVNTFNDGWSLTRQDGSSIALEELPYSGKSEPDEKLVMENTIPEEFRGLSLAFLSADKTIRVWIDGRKVYEFGVADERIFGHTPGSVVNFIDIPAHLEEGKIRIEMTSPYADYAAKLSDITVGKRDVLILKLLTDNLFNIICCFVTVICGIDIGLLFLIQKISGQNTGGQQYLCWYCIVAAIYYFIETKTMSIFYGNQTLYSVLVFLCLMMLPFWLALYFANGRFACCRKRWLVLLGLAGCNIFFQVALQLWNILDFMEMAFVSHGLIILTMIVVGKSYIDTVKKKRDGELIIEMTALFLVGLGGVVDIVRMYLIGAGDMGKFSRFGTTAFSVIMLYGHFRQIIRGYSHNIEENARLLQHEVEYMEKKNEQLRRANELAEEARQEALAANAAKGKFLAHMSHEIRTPINAVLGMDTMILRESKEIQIKEYALDIQNAGQNLLALINDILDFSKIESGKLEIIPVEYDISSMIHDISNMITSKVEVKKLEFHICVDERIPSKLYGDDVRIRQVLVNLLNNAVKYTHKGSVTLRVGGETKDGKAFLSFSVEDTGIGIKEEDIARLFNEFERIEEKRNRNIEGSGLGLNITTQLLRLMDSRLDVESVYGKGSRFYFTLEQQIVDAKPVGNLEERIRRQNTEYSYAAVFTAPEAQILVVDDNAVNLKVFISLLKATMVNVDVADGGRACLEMASKKHYDLIFLDHMMPEMDGIETLHHLKEMPECRLENTAVIALTANAISGAKEMYLAEGFDAFLSKPINPEKLEQMILRLLPRELLVFEPEEDSAERVQEGGADRLEASAADGHTNGTYKMQPSGDEELPAVDGVDWSYGLLHLPDRELLLETVTDFYKAIDGEADSLERFYQGCREEYRSNEENCSGEEKPGNGESCSNGEYRSNPEMMNQYRIKVHSMKSSANMIGATVLGGMAKLLENGARDGDMELLDRLTEVFLAEWRSYKDKLKECVKVEEAEGDKKDVEDYTVILAYLEMLRTAMAELDIDGMDENMARLDEFSYPPDVQENMQRLSLLVSAMDAGQAVGLIAELMEQIKQLPGVA